MRKIALALIVVSLGCVAPKEETASTGTATGAAVPTLSAPDPGVSPPPAPEPPAAAQETPPASAPTTPAAETVALPADAFTRSPLIARVRLADGRDFVAITAHLAPKNAVAEAAWLDDVYEHEAAQAGVESAVIMGDLNLGCDYASKAEVDALDLRRDGRFTWLVDNDGDTNSAATKCAYDRIVVTGDAFAGAELTGIIPLEPDISDHMPVVARAAEFNFATFNVQRFGKTRSAEPAVVSELARVACMVDLIMMQEIVGPSDDARAAVTKIVDEAKEACGRTFELHVSDATGTDDYTERYAILYDPAVVLSMTARLFNGDGAPDPAPEAQSPPAAPSLPNADSPPASPPPAPSPSPAAQGNDACGVEPYVTPGGYCYASVAGKKKRVSMGCCKQD